MSSRRTLLICIDGATFNLLDGYIEKGLLPNINKVIKNGVRGNFESTVPPVTCPAWPSLFTGKNPGKYGVFYFVERGKDYKLESNSALDVKAPFLWEILEDNEIKSGIVNLPWFSPLSEKLSFGATGQVCLSDEVKNLDSYKHERFKFRSGKDPSNLARKTFKKFREIANNKEWEFLALGFYYTDLFQHKEWDLETVKEVWGAIDRGIGKLLSEVGEINIFIVSDHGFGPTKKKFSVNRWLEREGYLKESGEEKGWKLTILNFISKLAKSRLSVLIRKMPNFLSNKVKEIHKTKVTPFVWSNVLDRITWDSTEAYSYGDQGKIWLNLKGREPEGIVGENEYEEIRNEIVEKLKNLNGPNGENLRTTVYKKEEVYYGDEMENSPDIVFMIEDGKYRASGSFDESVFNEADFKAHHRKNGIFIANGPDIREDFEINDVKIYDLTPTVLHMFNVKIPGDMDGKVLKNIFKKESPCSEKDIKYGRKGGKVQRDGKVQEKEKDELKKRLEKLGYLE